MNEDYSLGTAVEREREARERVQVEEERRDRLETLTAERVEVVEDMVSEDWYTLLNLAVSCRSTKFLQARLNDLAKLSRKIEDLEAQVDA